MSLTERPGFLRLHGQAAISFQETTAFVGRRQTEFDTVSTVRMEFRPLANGESAGLTVFMAPKYHYDVCKVRRDGKTYVELVKQVSDMHEVTAEKEVGDGPLLLRIESTAESYKFSYAQEDGVWVQLGSGDERQIASEIANVWSGMYVGMFAVSAAGEAAPADFDWFEYKVKE